MTLTKTQVLSLMDRYGITPSRALGQNFVVDPNTVRRIVRLADIAPGDRVIEVGPGLGSLTLALAEAGAQVTAIELDRRLAQVLRDTVEGPMVTVVEHDAMTYDWASADASRLVANLPYNVATPLVLEVMRKAPQVESLLVMVQREVGERLAAPPGSKAYGIPSVKLAYYAHAEVVGTVGANVFVPKPRVESALVKVERRPPPASAVPAPEIFELVDRAFGQRRKMLRRSLRGWVTDDAFAAAQISPENRPEQLAIGDWVRLAEVAHDRD